MATHLGYWGNQITTIRDTTDLLLKLPSTFHTSHPSPLRPHLDLTVQSHSSVAMHACDESDSGVSKLPEANKLPYFGTVQAP